MGAIETGKASLRSSFFLSPKTPREMRLLGYTAGDCVPGGGECIASEAHTNMRVQHALVAGTSFQAASWRLRASSVNPAVLDLFEHSHAVFQAGERDVGSARLIDLYLDETPLGGIVEDRMVVFLKVHLDEAALRTAVESLAVDHGIAPTALVPFAVHLEDLARILSTRRSIFDDPFGVDTATGTAHDLRRLAADLAALKPTRTSRECLVAITISGEERRARAIAS